MMWVWTKTLSALRAFRVAHGGNVAITFAFATLPIIATVGYAVDYSRANSVKVAMQAALDSTALMISKEAVKDTPAQLQDNAKAYFLAMFNRSDVKNITVTTTYDSANPTQVAISSSVDVPTTFLAAVGWDTMTVGNSSTVKWGSSRLRVALVLDNTGSMSQGGTTPQTSKLAALQTATANLLTQLKNAAAVPGDVYVSIIPFVKDVNLGAANYSSDYLDFTTWKAEPPYIATNKPSGWSNVGPGSSCPFSNNGQGFTCTTGPVNGSSSTSTIPSSGAYAGYICPSIDNGNKLTLQAGVYYNGCYNSVPTTSTKTNTIATGKNASCGSAQNCSCSGSGNNKVCTQTVTTTGAPYTHTWIPNVPSATTWNGCVVDRGNSNGPNVNNYDTNVASPDVTIAASLYSAEQYGSCPQAAMGLSYDWTTMNSLVTDMAAAGNTNQAIGLQLGWMSLVGAGPFTAPPMDSNYTYSQVIILLTDGLNTQDRWYTSQSSIDARQKITCKNINDAGITLYTIQVDTDGEATSTLLQNCAGTAATATTAAVYPDPSKFFLLTSPDAIVTTFNQIGTKLSNLYVAK